MSQMNEANGPVIDVEVSEDSSPITSSSRPRSRFGITALVVLFLVAIAGILGGAVSYAWLGLDVFGGQNSDRIAALETRLTTLEESGAAQAAQRQAIADRLDALGLAIDGFAGLQAKVTELESQQVALSQSIQGLGDLSAVSNPAIADQLAKLQAQVATLEQKLQQAPAARPSGIAQAFARGLPLGSSVDQVNDPVAKKALEIFRDKAPPSPDQLIEELAAILVAVKSKPISQPPATDGWQGWLMEVVSYFFTIKPIGSRLVDQLETAVREKDVSKAVELLADAGGRVPEADDWLARAQAYVSGRLVIQSLEADGQ